jgi:hypothetical protein
MKGKKGGPRIFTDYTDSSATTQGTEEHRKSDKFGEKGSVTRTPTAGVRLSVIFLAIGPGFDELAVPAATAGEEPALMDSIVMIMFGSVLCTMTALSFMELRKIRKKLEKQQSGS